jgi:inner membrane protease subunit 1
MLPTLYSKDFVLIRHWRINQDMLRRGDVITAISPLDPHMYISKRIVGLPGDVVCVDPTVTGGTFTQVPKGHVWLSGDNSANSTDSRYYGSVPIGLIQGRLVCRLWPEFSWVR